MTDEPETEAATVARIATAGAGPEPVTIDLADAPPSIVRVPDGQRLVIIDPERFVDWPRRSFGTIEVRDAASFQQAVVQRVAAPADAVLYADDHSTSLVAVLNDDSAGDPGWRDYRVRLALVATPEWKRWTARDGQLTAQGNYAEFIEESLADIEEPAAATMLELAQTFEATRTGRFKQASRLGTGARTLSYEETIEQGSAHRDEGAAIVLPERMVLGLRPFYGAQIRTDDGYAEGRYRIEALVKFRITNEGLTIGHRLVQPDEVRREAFQTTTAQVAEGLGLTALAAPAPAAVEAPAIVVSEAPRF